MSGYSDLLYTLTIGDLILAPFFHQIRLVEFRTRHFLVLPGGDDRPAVVMNPTLEQQIHAGLGQGRHPLYGIESHTGRKEKPCEIGREVCTID